MQNISHLISKPKDKLYRFSAVRNFILEFLTSSSKPLSAFDLQKMLKLNKLSVNKTTVYRELDFLKNQNSIEEFKLDDGIRRYEILSYHHHHTVCTKCGEIKCVELNKDLESQEKKIEKNNKFKIISHSLEFYGLCHKCQAVK